MVPESIAELVGSLAAQGVGVFLEEGRLQCRGPRGVLSAELLETIRGHRDEIVRFLEREHDPSRPHPLTAGQQSLLLHQRLTPNSVAYNLAFAANADNALDAESLDAALREVVTRHSILRTTYAWQDGEPTQRTQPVPARILDTQTVAAELVESTVEAFMDRPFDLEREAPIRAAIICTGLEDQRPVIVLVVHHIAADLWSIDVIVEQWLGGYRNRVDNGGPRSAPIGSNFIDQVRSEAAWLASSAADVERSLAFWRDRLGDEPAVLNLPFDRPHPAVQSFGGGRISLELDAALSTRIDALARKADVTPNMLFLSAFQVLLQKYSGSDDVVVGTPVAGRRTPPVQNAVGFFADPVVVRADLRGDPPFAHVLDATRANLLNALDHPYPFPLLVEQLNPVRDPRRSPLFQVMYVWQQTRQRHDQVRLTPLSSSGQRGAAYDLVLSVGQSGGRFSCSWSYNLGLFNRSTVERMAHAFLEILGGIVARPSDPISLLPSMSADELGAVRRVSAGPVTELCEPPWPEQFDSQARRTPTATALVCGDETLTYQQLADRVGRCSAALRARGVAEEVRVGLCIERSAALVVAMLAIARAGGVYVPLDPDYPADRLAHMASDSGIALCVADERGRLALRSHRGEVLDLDVLIGEAAALEPSPAAAVSGDALAYLIYTSGSTGRPKGVMVTRRNVANLFAGLDGSVGEGPGTAQAQPVWLAVTSVCFDISVLELLWTLCRGHQVVIEPELWTARARPVPSRDRRKVDFSLFYFAAEPGPRRGSEVYRLLLDGARFADTHGLHAVWLPERHFHAFGGAYPNPSVLAAAVAAVTERVGIRAGSVVLPLQDQLRVAEEWAAVDNLADGRVGLSFASGWQPDDFVLAPTRYADRRETMWQDIETVRRLWRGESAPRTNGVGAEVQVTTLPRPVQLELPAWATAAGSDETFRQAGERGLNILTHLLGQNIHELARRIRVYRESRAAAGHDEGVVTLMLHTFVHPDEELVREAVTEPFKNYLRSSIDLMRGLAKGLGLDPVQHQDLIVNHAFDRYFRTSALFGTPESCADFARELANIGVDEIACLIDFGVGDKQALDALRNIVAVQHAVSSGPGGRTPTVSEAIARHGVTHLQCTPAFAGLLLLERKGAPTEKGPLRRLLVGGDAAPPELAGRLRDTGVTEVFNMYGPTETCVWSAVQQLETDRLGRVTVGGPIANTTLQVLDARLQPVPAGVPGELHIGGAGVARGYWNRPGLTADRFIPDPFATRTGARMYRTGDIVRSLGDGRLEFLGRADHQVKVRGYRIEPGEIENVLGTHPGIDSCAVVARRDRGGDAALVAFVVPRAGTEWAEWSVRAHARRLLPEHMVPSQIVDVEGLPLTLNGKVDRAALVAQANEVDGSRRAAYVAPRNRIEDSLQQIWQELLERPGVGVHENFFEIGGHSLLAAKLHARIVAAELGDIELVDLFSHPTIAGLGARLGDGGDAANVRVRSIDSRVSRQQAAARRQQRRRQGS
ncbi:MupA/Atu3671 family FMN-dependent luciferase-like monooxygenase [Wenjunlia tyrosinilytica]|uniref:Carrier domain-containing protein n=1 Tax=Wenjunlia tyrosinilytica TaxID=1544741 RepID=A0A917ZWP7_9ACTN|nr:MupA/Atu3671 family FMN-dependent luciferase-like monooxygenase [Wenjunlia tyrosinilytica]GGO96045.1 hypothetical protein GCM10012280_54670 [Wenjunlia tyrosinilytica]